MPDVLLFGATGYTGKLTAHALAKRNADFVVAGRDPKKLEALAAETKAADLRVAAVGDVPALVRALEDVKVMITCVGPFSELGTTALEAALAAKVHYIDSAGEAQWIARLIRESDADARAAGIAIAPAMGFDEVPADVAATLATEGMKEAELVLTYAFPSHGSNGTIRTILTNISGREGQWIQNGEPRPAKAAEEQRWAPMPPPLGPKHSVAFGFAESYLAPLHIDLASLKTFLTADRISSLAIRWGSPALRIALSLPGSKHAIEKMFPTGGGPDAATRAKSRFTVLAEARAGQQWRNVAVVGTDPYGLTGETLAAAAIRMAEPGYSTSGVVAPVQAVGLDYLQKTLIDLEVSTETYTYS
ncbi:MAG TPA: saccharopine dehydrogenase NADP-binding domain-containing protein [Actinomycetota bacterium]|nr:saccharopine dehydrogenase NADP-binding domain-containing protein [Actinomycetota bacterium]